MTTTKKYLITYEIEACDQCHGSGIVERNLNGHDVEITCVCKDGLFDTEYVTKTAEVGATSDGVAWRIFFAEHRGVTPLSIEEVEPSDYSHSTSEND